jgi:hypothetical protein
VAAFLADRIALGDPIVVETLAAQGCDWLVVDRAGVRCARQGSDALLAVPPGTLAYQLVRPGCGTTGQRGGRNDGDCLLPLQSWVEMFDYDLIV